MSPWFITINDKGLLEVTNEGLLCGPIIVESEEDLQIVVGSDDLLCSSSLDYPDEYTSDPFVIELCGLIRG